MKKVFVLVLALALLVSTAALAETVKIGATLVPHVEVLEFIKPLLAEKGFELDITPFTDYPLINPAVEAGELDANYFQHTAYLSVFNEQNDGHLVPVIPVHFEPMGVFKGKCDSLDALKDGASIGVPNDPSNEARALLVLEKLGLIVLDPNAGVNATKLDIVDNPKNLDIVEMDAAQLPRALADLDLAVINGNYALDAGLSLLTDTVGAEDSDALVYPQSVNYIVVKEGNEDAAFVEALREALNAPETAAFMTDTYQGSVILALDAVLPE